MDHIEAIVRDLEIRTARLEAQVEDLQNGHRITDLAARVEELQKETLILRQELREIQRQVFLTAGAMTVLIPTLSLILNLLFRGIR